MKKLNGALVTSEGTRIRIKYVMSEKAVKKLVKSLKKDTKMKSSGNTFWGYKVKYDNLRRKVCSMRFKIEEA